MAIKFNKDALLKHRFWIMLGVTFFFALVGILYLELGVDAGDERKKIVEWFNRDKSTKGMNNLSTIQVMADKAGQAKLLESTIWEAGYKAQAPLFTWPAAIESKYDFTSGKFALEVKVSKVDPAAWPADTDTRVHGTFVDRDAEGFRIQPRKGKPIYFNRTDKFQKITIADENKTASLNEGLDKISKDKDRMVEVLFQTGRYFNDVLITGEQFAYRNAYKDQIHPILKSVNPLDEKSNGVVQLRDWLYRPAPDLPEKEKATRFFRYVAEDFDHNEDIYREIWIAQENLWIQAEIYRMIAEANKEVSHYVGKGGKSRPEGYSFKNPNFTLHLNLDAKGTLTFKIQNLLDRKQSIDLTFRVLLNDAAGFDPETIRISGTPLNPKGAAGDSAIHSLEIAKSPRNAVMSVEQVLSWQSAAVKRIDQITIGSNADAEASHSHRTYERSLIPFDKNDIGKAGEEKPGISPTRPIEGGLRPGPGFGGSGFGGGVGGAGGNQGNLKNELWTYRYVDVSPQSRRIPIGVVLIVDQDHVDRVLTSFNNSKLRFLPTQVLLNQYAGSLQPPTPTEKLVGVGPGGFPNFPEAGFGPGFGRDPFMKGPGATPGGPGESGSGDGDVESNMELVIYGIMTLYQRYPPAPPKPAPPPKI